MHVSSPTSDPKPNRSLKGSWSHLAVFTGRRGHQGPRQQALNPRTEAPPSVEADDERERCWLNSEGAGQRFLRRMTSFQSWANSGRGGPWTQPQAPQARETRAVLFANLSKANRASCRTFSRHTSPPLSPGDSVQDPRGRPTTDRPGPCTHCTLPCTCCHFREAPPASHWSIRVAGITTPAAWGHY